METCQKYEASPYNVLQHPLSSYIFMSKYFPQNFFLRRHVTTFGLPFRNQSQKATMSFVMSIRPPARMKEKLSADRVDWQFY